MSALFLRILQFSSILYKSESTRNKLQLRISLIFLIKLL